jgi:hypothetical protein
MDYAPFFAQAQQPFFGMAMAPTSTYNDDSDKMGHNVSNYLHLLDGATFSSLGRIR